ncbi:hypothetical protein A3E49_01505 [Candidatus Saccharibacteria bacterium RIFCSPHIGHO2_12_FULL_49_19]|nr:MAG: hypothetical protein A2708_01875 [Candidatus Saccharibacteria bacterium RIFCSPHIGHO2_01_FULL_49_21]OGL36598.1 MAG: hypothetical protein A3E49_01505 [Candidatus Saccharibacteria bacterium RIFCSPHIGHO2_12_FULL_49_19]OGL37863.1 MAG: hypothetical protein A3B63_00425 [Candidatus Saccharibacteria bacterium RIFCSPLOWO2_01_FULL_49_22]
MIEQFVKELLKEKALPGNLEPAVYDRMVKDLSTRVTDLINRRCIESMSPEQLKEFEDLMDKHPGDIGILQNFVNEHVKNKEGITSTALLEFRSLYLGTT